MSEPQRPADSAARQAFWEQVHRGKEAHAVSWWQQVPALSLGLIDRSGVDPARAVIDVGSGSSTLIDHLLGRGFADLTAVDLSAKALRVVEERLGAAADSVVLRVADILDLRPDRRYALWHDRAVFHFLTEPGERDAYRASVERSLQPDGSLVLATFGPQGPTACSGLPVVRYSAAALAAEFPGFDLVATSEEEHLTPWGGSQLFTAVLLRRR